MSNTWTRLTSEKLKEKALPCHPGPQLRTIFITAVSDLILSDLTGGVLISVVGLEAKHKNRLVAGSTRSTVVHAPINPLIKLWMSYDCAIRLIGVVTQSDPVTTA